MGYPEFDATLPPASWLYGRQDDSNRWHLVSAHDHERGLCGIRLFEFWVKNNAQEAMLWEQRPWSSGHNYRYSLCKKCRDHLLADTTSAVSCGRLPVNWRGVPGDRIPS